MIKFLKKLFGRKKKKEEIIEATIGKENKLRETYFKSSSTNFEQWKYFDEKDRLVYYKNSNGFEYWKEYNDETNSIYYRNSNGYEFWEKYDDNGNIIYYKSHLDDRNDKETITLGA